VKAKILVLLGCVSIVLQVKARPQVLSDPQLDAARQSFANKQKEILSNVVAPCRDRAEALANREEERQKHCDCFGSQTEQNESLATLHRVTKQAFVRCDLKGLDAQIGYIDQREGAVRATLRDMISKFRANAGAYESWGEDAEKGRKEAQDKISQIVISTTFTAMVGDLTETNEKAMRARVDEVARHAKRLRDVRRARTGELRDLVVAMRKELTGKSQAEAKRIVTDYLNAANVAIADVGSIEKRLADGMTKFPREDDPSAEEKTQSYLEGDYANLLTAIEIAANHGLKDARVFARAAGILAFAPDAIDAAAILFNAAAVGDNISGLDKLRGAAEQQRATLDAELRILVEQRHEIAAKRGDLAQATKLDATR
jgi:hypothetical protein